MQQKRTASLPIFNRGKRPRQALLSHPNNVDGDSSQQPQRRDAQWNAPDTRQYSDSVYKPPTTTARAQATFTTPGRQTSGSYSHFQTNKENFQPTSRSDSHFMEPPGGSRHQLNHPGRATNTQPSPSNRPGSFTPYKGPKHQPQTFQQPPTHSNHSFQHMQRTQASFPPGRAAEPTQQHSAKQEPRVAVQKTSHLPRVLTATARGVAHWSKFKTQIPMLFEVVGTLDSAVVAGPLGSREFSVRAGDGSLRALYWEIDTTLPHLVRGKPIRVVGSWDEKGEWLKCHSVREASQDEARTTEELVTVCDAVMRRTVATMPEM